MKKIVFLAGVFLLLLGGCRPRASVSLEFRNAEGENVLLFKPVNYNLLGVNDTLKGIKNDTVYRLQLDIEKIAPFQLMIAGRELCLLIEPGQQLTVECDLKKSMPFRTGGDNAAGEELYNRQAVYKNPYRYEWVDHIEYPLDSVPERVETYFRELQRKEIRQYDSLYRLEQISEPFLNYVSNDIRLYYSMTLSKIARALTEGPWQQAFGDYWTRLYTEHPLQEEDLSSRWCDEYAKLYVLFYLPFKENFRPNITSAEEYYKFIYDYYERHISNPRILESVLGRKLFLEALNNKTGSLGILDCFDRFNRQFPGTPYAPYYAVFQRQLEEYQQKTQQDFPAGIKFVEGYAGIDSWEELTASFRGKPLFIDFWFSTCGPCREEFAYARALEQFLQGQGIELLYISVDEEKREENWKNAIKYFDLKGWHLRASRALYTDFAGKFGIRNFPTYMLLDKDGKAVLTNAKRPSEEEALYRQITEAL